jgi:3-phosphoshikimate 1-carboxyvinyltransferase
MAAMPPPYLAGPVAGICHLPESGMNLASTPAVPLTAERSPWLRGQLRLPGDPRLSALVLILAGMARGESVIENLHHGPGTAAVIAALRQLGVGIMPHGQRMHVQGLGVGGLLTPDGPIDLKQAGAAAPLLIGLLGGFAMRTELSGVAASPANEAILGFLGRNGARVHREGHSVMLEGPRFGIPLDVALPGEARDLVAPLLLNGLVTAGRSILSVPEGLSDPAEQLLMLFGAGLGAEHHEGSVRLTLEGMSPLRAQALAVPGDPVLAAYPAVAALVAPDSELTLHGVALHPEAMALLDALALLGADISIGESYRGGADITVRHGPLIGTAMPPELVLAPEDYPILAVAAAFAEGETLLRLSEGVRRFSLSEALRANGVTCLAQAGALVVRGQKRVPGGGKVTTRLDPKLAMAFLVLGMAADRPVTIDDGAVMADLFPGFVEAFEQAGASFTRGET